MLKRSAVGATAALLVAPLTAMLATSPAVAGTAPGDPGYDVYAHVVDVTPRYVWRDVSEPMRQCEEPIADYGSAGPADGRSADRYHRGYGRPASPPGAGVAAALVGGLIGAVVGHEVGHGHGRAPLTIAGAVLGSAIARERVGKGDRGYYGERRRSRPAVQTRIIRRCTETTRTRRVREVDGYDVAYRFQGTTFHKWVDQPPGDTVRVHVSVDADSAAVHAPFTNVATSTGDPS